MRNWDNRFLVRKTKKFYVEVPPDGVIIDERQHPKGSFVSIFQHNDGGLYFVCRRHHRREWYVEPFMPNSYPYQTKSLADIDITFKEYFSGWGFDLETEAREYFNHILSEEYHPKALDARILRKPDAQRTKCYHWENPIYRDNGCFISMKEKKAIKMLRMIESDYEPNESIELTFIESLDNKYIRYDNRINIKPSCTNRGFVVHESAHWLTWKIYPDNGIVAHGPEFMGVLILMMERYCGMKKLDLITSATQAGLKFKFPPGGLEAFINDQTTER